MLLFAAAFAAGVLMPFAFAPYGHRLLGVAALAAFAALAFRAPERRAAIGFGFGCGWFVVGAWWLAPVFHTFGNLPWPLAWLAEAAIGLVLGLHGALWAWLVPARGRWRALGFVGAGMLVEYLRGHWFSGLPWTAIGTLVLDTPAQGWLAVFGVYGAALWPLVLAAGIAELAVSARTRPFFGAILVLAALITAPLAPTPALVAGKPMRALLVQPNIAEEEKWTRQGLAKALARLERLSARKKADLVLWPEAALPFALEDAPWAPAWLARIVQRAKAPLAFGALRHRKDGKLQNGLQLWTEQGDAGFAGKRKLVPFGEYVPFWGRGWMRRLVPAIGDFAPAKDARPLVLGPLRIGALICYESIFPEEARARVQAGANVLVVVTNDAWYGRAPAAWQHWEAARARAVETGRWVLHATNTGITGAIRPDGSIAARLAWWSARARSVSFAPMRGTTPYLVMGDAPALGFAAGLLVAAWWRRRRA